STYASNRKARIAPAELRSLLEEAAQFRWRAEKTSTRADLVHPGDREPVIPTVPDSAIQPSRLSASRAFGHSRRRCREAQYVHRARQPAPRNLRRACDQCLLGAKRG